MKSNRVELTSDAPLMSRAQVLQAYGNRSVSWLYAEMAAGRVPRQIRLSSNAVAWVTAQIQANIAEKIAAGPVESTAKPRLPKAEAVAA
jgi:predicted DNA-binding transcriptional regulator AlpA